jgi:hypothetical protein
VSSHFFTRITHSTARTSSGTSDLDDIRKMQCGLALPDHRQAAYEDENKLA